MRRLRALLGKEIRQHAWTGLALGFCLAALFALLLATAWLAPETISLMQVHAGFLTFAICGAMVLGNRLVVSEYYGRSQLFVEALPLARWEMLAVKYVLGLALLLIATALSLGIAALVSATREAIDWRFLTIVAARSGTIIFFFWSWFFGMGLVGRFRVAIYLGILIAVMFLDGFTAFEILHFGPIAVLDNTTLPFEREIMPTRALLVTLALGAGWTALGFALALINEGSVAEILAKRMSQREKSIIGILFIALALAYTLIEERRDKPPYNFPEEEVIKSEAVPLEILYLLPERRADAEALMAWLEDDLSRFSRALGWSSLPEVRLAFSPSLEAGFFDTAELQLNDGILIRANFGSDIDWDPRALSAYVLARVLDGATDDRARFEPKAWLRDGFAEWWSHRRQLTDDSSGDREATDSLETSCSDEASLLLRALWTTRHDPLDTSRLARWLRYRERHGEELASAVAFSGLRILEQQADRDAVLHLARQVFGRQPHRDIRELFYEWRHPMEEVFAQATAQGWEPFLASWNNELERLRTREPCRARLAQLPEGTAQIEIESGEGTIRDVVYGFQFTEPLPQGTTTTLLHHRLSAFDSELERRDLLRVERFWPSETRETSWRLPGLYRRDNRAFLAVEIESEILGCPIRFDAQRRTFQ